jgi:hypothetical protein
LLFKLKTYFNAEVILVEARGAVGFSGDELADLGSWNSGDHGGGEREDDGEGLHVLNRGRDCLKVIVGPKIRVGCIWRVVVVVYCYRERERVGGALAEGLNERLWFMKDVETIMRRERRSGVCASGDCSS